MKKILYAAALLCIIASCSKEEATPAQPEFFFVKLYWSKDSLVSYGHPDKGGPIMQIYPGSWGADSGLGVFLFPAFGGRAASGANEPYLSAIKNGTDTLGYYRSFTLWALKTTRDQVILTVDGTEALFIDKMAQHPEWGKYCEGRIRFTGFYTTNNTELFSVSGTFRVKTF